MNPTALALRDFLQYAMFETTAYHSGVFLDLRRPWENTAAFREIVDVLVDVAQRTAMTAVGFHGDTQHGELGRRAITQLRMIRRAQKEKSVFIFDDPVATFMHPNDPLSKPRLIIIDDISDPERDTNRTRGYVHLYDLHSIIQRRPVLKMNNDVTEPWLKFFERRPWDPTVLPDRMRRL